MPPATVDRLAHVERQRYGLAGIESPLDGDRRPSDDDRRRRGVDLRAGLGQAGERQIGGIAGAVGDGGAVEIDRRHRQVGGVLTGRNRVAEGQRAGAGAAA